MKFKTLGLITLFTIVGCKNGVKDKNQSIDRISFDRSKIELVGIEVKASDSQWPDIKDFGVFSFQTCLTDNAYMNSIAGEKFEVRTENYSIVKTTNAQGCLSWLEKVKFNYLEDEKYIPLKGVIKAVGNYSGGRSFEIAVNPWRESVVDQQFGKVNSSESLVTAEAIDNGDKIVLPQATISILSHQFLNNETVLDLEIITRPQLVRRNFNGSILKEPFSGGIFNIDYYLLSKNTTTLARRVLSQESVQEKIGQEGRLTSRVQFRINQKIDAKEIIELGLRLKGHEAPVDLGVAEGVIGFKQLTGTITSDLLEIPEGLRSIVASNLKMNNLENLDAKEEDSFGFLVDTVSITPGAEVGDNLNNLSEKRTVESTIKACLVDSLVKEPIKNGIFFVEVKEESGNVVFKQKIESELRSGCLSFRAQIPYKRFETQKWKKYSLNFTGLQEPFLNVSKKRMVFINPWIRTPDFGIDSEVGTAPEVTATKSPKLFVSNLNYNFLGNGQGNVKINKALDLLVNRSYMIEMQPKIMVDNRFEGDQAGLESVMSGQFRMRLLVLAPKANVDIDYTTEIDLNDFYTLTGTEKTVSSEAGTIRARVDLPLLFSDLLIFSFKNIILVELSPLQAGSSLRNGYFVGVMNGSVKRDSLGMSLESKKELSSRNLDISKNLLSRVNYVKSKLVADKFLPSTKKFFMDTLITKLQGTTSAFNPKTGVVEKTKNLVYVYSSEESFAKAFGLALSPNEISSLIDNPNNLNSRLVDEICHSFYDRRVSIGNTSVLSPISVKGYEHKRCKNDIESHINFMNFKHVESISAQPTSLQTQGGSFSRNSTSYIMSTENFYKGIGEGRGEGSTHSLGFNAGVSFNKIVAVGGGYSYSKSSKHEFFVNKSTELNLNIGTRADVVDTQRYSYDKFTVNFKANVTKCLLMIPKAIDLNKGQETKGKGSRFVSSPRRIYICKSAPVIENVDESFYMVKNVESGIMADTDSSNSQLVTFIRGQKLFQDFQQQIQDSSLNLIIVKIRDEEIKEKYDSYLKNESKIDYKKRFDGSMPGLIDK